MFENLIDKFSDTLCFAPTVGCASLMVLGAILFLIKFPFHILQNILEVVKKG